MHVRPRPELVNLGLEEDVNPHELTGRYLSPEQFLAEMQDENTVVLDVRNTYEYDVGHFRGAIRPEVKISVIHQNGSVQTVSYSKGKMF